MGAQTLAMARGYPPGLNIKIDNSIVEFLVAKVTARTHARQVASRHAPLRLDATLQIEPAKYPFTEHRRPRLYGALCEAAQTSA